MATINEYRRHVRQCHSRSTLASANKEYRQSVRESKSDSTLSSFLKFSDGTQTPKSASQFTVSKVPDEVVELLDTWQLEVDDNFVVQWRPDSITHPRNWPMSRKLYDTAIICILEFFTTLVSNTGSSAARYASNDIGVGQELAIFCFVTLYLLGQAIGGIVFPPVAETFGGRTIYFIGAVGFCVSCLIIGAAPSLPTVVIGRFASGVFSAMPTVVAVGSIENMWDAKGRIWVIQVWVMLAIIALALGPPVATYMSESSIGWEWIYYCAAIGSGILTISCFWMKESRPALVLRECVKRITSRTGFHKLVLGEELRLPTAREFVRQNLTLPLQLWFTELLVFLVALMAAISYGFIYLFAEALHAVYHEGFGLNEKHSSLTFLAIGIGVLFTIIPRFYDLHVTNLEAKQGHPLEPEVKLLGYYVAAPLLALGLWWFACTVPPLIEGVSFWVSVASLIFVGYAIVEFDSVLCAYLTDTYMSYASSANAPVAFLRAVLSGVFPLFAPRMFKNMGANNALFVLAALSTAFCGIAVLFKLYAKRIRERSPFAQKTWAEEWEGKEQSKEGLA